jgi:hypothetical protein
MENARPNRTLLNSVRMSKEVKEELESFPYKVTDLAKFKLYVTTKKELEEMKFMKIERGEKTAFLDISMPINDLAVKLMGLPEDVQDRAFEINREYKSLKRKSENYRRASISRNRKEYRTKDKLNKKDFFVEKKIELVEYFGKLYSIEEVFEIVLRDWGTKVDKEELQEFYKDNYELISQRIEKHRNDFSELRLTTKKSRLEELTFLYNRVKRRLVKQNSKEDYRAANMLLEQIRKETEGDIINLNGKMDLTIEQNVNYRVRKEFMADLPLKEMILSKIATKKGIDVKNLIEQLNRSVYSKMNSLLDQGEEVEDIDYELVRHPNDQVYGLEVLETKGESTKDEAEPNEQGNTKTMKELLLERLREKGEKNKSLEDKIKKNAK